MNVMFVLSFALRCVWGALKCKLIPWRWMTMSSWCMFFRHIPLFLGVGGGSSGEGQWLCIIKKPGVRKWWMSACLMGMPEIIWGIFLLFVIDCKFLSFKWNRVICPMGCVFISTVKISLLFGFCVCHNHCNFYLINSRFYPHF